MSNNPSSSRNEQHDYVVDLLVQKFTTGLDEAEQQELDLLESPTENRIKREQFEVAATAFDLSFAGDREEMPKDLHDRLLVSAGKFFGSHHVDEAIRTTATYESANLEPSNLNSHSVSGRNWREIIAVVVTAACLFLLLSGFNPFVPKDPATASAAEMLRVFEKSRPNDFVEVVWTPVHDKDANGRVVWSDKNQEGYMEFTGLDVNDPKVEQYQLWIFDTDPDQEVPVDGGVFDIKEVDIQPNGKVVIPINPHVPVRKAVQFAVTKEKPGGVMRSDRKQIPVLAKVEKEED